MTEIPTDHLRRHIEHKQMKSVARDLGALTIVCYGLAFALRKWARNVDMYDN